MALNQTEQQLLDYVLKNPEERQFWEQKLRMISAAHRDDFVAAAAIDLELRAYLAERARVVADLAGAPVTMSMRNLAEYFLRTWIAPRPKKKPNSVPVERE